MCVPVSDAVARVRGGRSPINHQGHQEHQKAGVSLVNLVNLVLLVVHGFGPAKRV